MGGVPRRDQPPEDRVPTPGPDARAVPVRRRLLVGLYLLLAAAVAVSLIVLGPGIVRGLGDPGDEGPAERSVTGAAPEAPEGEAALTGETIEGIDRALDDSTATATSAVVVDPATGDRLYTRDDGAEMIPASNQKIMTELSLLHHAGPQRRLATTVVEGSSPGHLVLVAGGDTLLGEGESDPDAVVGRAGLATLAARTAETMTGDRLAEETGEQITVDVDTSIFEGPELNDTWLPGDIAADEIGPIAPLAIGSHALPGAEEGDGRGHDTDAAGGAADVFAQRLQEELWERSGRDVSVTTGERTETGADPSLPADRQPGPTELARVESAPLVEQATVMMNDSDNRLAEALGRVAADAAGHPGSVDGARAAMREALTESLGRDVVEHDGVVLADCSGMSPENRVTARVLGEVLLHAARDTTGRYAPMISTFPVSGHSGTLEDRFDDRDEAAARGVARAKTGTLRGVTALSGQVITQNGQPLIAVVLLGEVGDPAAATDGADRVFAGLARQ